MSTKNSSYFSHDSNARNDEKILAVRMRHGAEGYGIYFMLLERLRDEADYMSVKDYNMLAFDFRVSAEKVKSVVEDFGLFSFSEDGKKLYSDSFLNRMRIKDETKKSLSEAGKKGMEERWGKAKKQSETGDTITTLSESDNEVITSLQNSITSKVKERKEKKSNNNTPLPPEGELSPKTDEPIVAKQKRKKKPPSSAPPPLTLPFPSQEFRETWETLAAMPKWRKKPLTALNSSLKSLGRYSEEFAINLMHRAIEGDYQGVVYADTDEKYQKWLKTKGGYINGKKIGTGCTNEELAATFAKHFANDT